jgi:predicted DNA-binding transcriptional regulator YafY
MFIINYLQDLLDQEERDWMSYILAEEYKEWVNKLKTETEKHVKFLYKNYKGEVAWRRVYPIRVEFLATPFHTTEQWILVAFDLDKNAERSFAMLDIISPFLPIDSPVNTNLELIEHIGRRLTISPISSK